MGRKLPFVITSLVLTTTVLILPLWVNLHVPLPPEVRISGIKWKLNGPFLNPIFNVTVRNPFQQLPTPPERPLSPLEKYQYSVASVFVAIQKTIEMRVSVSSWDAFPPIIATFDLQTRVLKGTLLGGSIEYKTKDLGWTLTTSGINNRQLSNHWFPFEYLEGTLQGTITAENDTLAIQIPGLKVSSSHIADSLPVLLQLIPNARSALSGLLESPFLISANVATGHSPTLTQLHAQNEFGMIKTIKKIPLDGRKNLNIPTRWYPTEARLDRQLADALRDPGLPPSLGLTIQVRESKLTLLTDNHEIDRKGKRWLKNQLSNIDMEKVRAAISKFRF